MPDGHLRSLDRPSILWVALGRQRVGKTALLNAAVQYFRERGNGVKVWNGDQQNRSHTLSTFFKDAEEVPSGGIEDGMLWIEGRIEDQIKHRYDAVLDVGGGATGFSKLVHEVPLLEALPDNLLRVVGLFCTGPERADLDYLAQLADTQAFMPAASVIVLNAGLVLSGRSAAGAFSPVLAHPVVKAALLRGAHVATMPALSCMAQVTDRGLTFAEAARGEVGDSGEPLSLFDRARVNRWWTRDVPAFFDALPGAWLPAGASASAESEAE